MKTIAFNQQGQRGGFLSGLFVLAAIGALYYYKKQGGSFTQLIENGAKGLTSARDMINKVAPSVAATVPPDTYT